MQKDDLFKWMKTIKHRRYKALFNGIFLMLGLVLLVVQSSPKFYLFSNNPVFHGTGKTFSQKIGVSSGNSSPNYHNCNFLSLDKRYDCKQVVALISPLFSVNHLSLDNETEVYYFPGKQVTNNIPTNFRRGPPTL
jgi:hypothetical protein